METKKNMKVKAIFFDRDGTLSDQPELYYPDKFIPFSFVKNVFLDCKNAGFKVFIITNQSCIARGTDNGYDFAKEFASYGADDFFICPHCDADNCDCRKPKTGLLEKANEKYNLNFSECVFVGDRETDMLCGKAVGMKTILVLSGRGKQFENSANADIVLKDISEINGKILKAL